jgi:hypothetical protein
MSDAMSMLQALFGGALTGSQDRFARIKDVGLGCARFNDYHLAVRKDLISGSVGGLLRNMWAINQSL